MILQAMFGKLEPVGSKRVGNDQLRTRIDVSTMNICHRSRMGQVELIEALVEANPARVEKGAHRAIGQEGT